MKIPLTRPYWGSEEERAVTQALRSSSAAGDGPWTDKLIQKIKLLTRAKYVYPVTSCTHGLELAMLAIDIKPGDEVVMPSFTMTSTANCVVLRGATPVFADIETETYGLDPFAVEKKITPKTKAIICVHYAGMPCQIEALVKIARRHKLFLVEDAAHSLGASYKNQALGTFADIGVYSLHGTKNISCGEGGIVVTNNHKLAELMAIYRVNGTNRQAFIEGRVAKYSWVAPGSSYLLAEPLAAIAVAQVGKIKQINQMRSQIAKKYTELLSEFVKADRGAVLGIRFLRVIKSKRLRSINSVNPKDGDSAQKQTPRRAQGHFLLPVIPRNTIPNWHIYALKFVSADLAKSFKDALNKKGIAAAFHYVPLHNSPMGKKLGSDRVTLPVTDEVSQALVRLPIYPGLTKKELNYIISSAQKALKQLSQ